MAFGESLAVFIQNEDVVKKIGFGKAQQMLEDPVEVG